MRRRLPNSHCDFGAYTQFTSKKCSPLPFSAVQILQKQNANSTV